MEAFDIDKKLDEIIRRYDLDEAYPNYRKKMKAEHVIRRLIESWGTHLRVACIVAYDSERHYLKHWLSKGQQVDIILCSRQEEDYFALNDAWHFERLKPVCQGVYDCVYLMTRHGAYFIESWLRQKHVQYQSLYDFLACKGLYFTSDWDEMMMDDEAEFWTYRAKYLPMKKYVSMETNREYLSANYFKSDVLLSALHLKKLFFIALYQRDLLLADTCVAQMKTAVREIRKQCERQLAAWKDIENLLTEMRQRLKARKQEDVFWLWTDAIPYDDIDDIPFLAKERAHGISFDHIFSMCPNTNPTLKLLLCGKKPVDDDTYSIKHITDENSPVFRNVHERGFRICAIGGHWPSIGNENRTDTYHAEYGAVTLRLWDALRQILLDDNEKLFVMVHSVAESHYPHLFATMTDQEIFASEQEQQKAANLFLDRQYRWYLDFLSPTCRKIYMTDHGGWSFRTMFHTLMILSGSGTKPKHINKLASFQDFNKILTAWLDTDDVDEEQVCRDYVEVQDLNAYSREFLDLIYRHHWPVSNRFYGYHGIIMNDKLYLRFMNGDEFVSSLTHWEGEPLALDNHIEKSDTDVERCRQILKGRTLPDSLAKKMKFHAAVEKDFLRAREPHRKKIRLLNEWIAGNPEKIAIRMGGEDAYLIYQNLTQQNKKKILCFVDSNPECACALFGLPIKKSLEDLPDGTTYLISSFKYREMLRKEARAEQGRLHLMDPYAFLKQHEILCNTGAAAFSLLEEDYNAGFPWFRVTK